MLKIKEAVIVEGKYDKLKLSNILDTLIIETNGFGIFKDKEKMKFVRRLADERGIIILTDSDHSGFQIRNYLASSIDNNKIKHIYIPDVYGKERRKKEPSKEGKIGVEGISGELLLSLFERADIDVKSVDKDNPITNYDLYNLGISGGNNSKKKKAELLKRLDLPEFISTSSLLSYLNSSMTKDELYSICDSDL